MISLNGKIAVNLGKVMKSLNTCDGRVVEVGRDHAWACGLASPLGDSPLGFAIIPCCSFLPVRADAAVESFQTGSWGLRQS